MADNKAILDTMRSRMDTATAAYSESRQSELDDLRFYAASPDNQWQWPQDVLNTRQSPNGDVIQARPCLTINKLPQHVRQVTNDQRQNRPAGKVIPVDDDADIAVAEVFDGIVRHIEYISDADVAYDTACENQVSFGEGYFRLLTEYCDDDSFDQELRIGRIRNSFSVYMDPTIQDPCGSDAEWCFITEEVTKAEYERLFPDAMPISSIQAQGVGDSSISAWIDEDTVRIAEYFWAEYQTVTLNQYANGKTAFEDDPKKPTGKPVKTRKVQRRVIKWMKTNGYEALEEKTWPGKYIPVVRVVGNEFEIDGRIYVSGLVRNAKDAQRMYNYWASQEAEMLALAPKAPFIGYGGQFEGYENQWKTANVQNWPYLEVNPDVTDQEGRPLPLPQRSQPPMAQNGIIEAKMGASDDIKSTTGQYDASLGNQSNETSGKAILARERQTDVGTFHFVDNLARGVRHLTRMIVDVFPKITDTARMVRTINLEGETSHIKIDPTQEGAVQEVKDEAGAILERIYNPTVGKYDVCVTTGPSYMTKRQETVETMVELSQGVQDPVLAGVMRYFTVKNLDAPDMPELAGIIKRLLPPGLLDTDKNMSPELAVAKQQMEGMSQEIQQLQGTLQQVAESIEVREQDRKDYETQIKEYDAETKRLAAMQPVMTPEEVAQIAYQTFLEIAQSQGPQMEQQEPEPPPDPMAEMQMQEPPADGGFFMPEQNEIPPEMGAAGTPPGTGF